MRTTFLESATITVITINYLLSSSIMFGFVVRPKSRFVVTPRQQPPPSSQLSSSLLPSSSKKGTAAATTSSSLYATTTTTTDEEPQPLPCDDNDNANAKKLVSLRLDGLDQPTVWHEFSPLAQKHGSVNLGQGFPDWNPPGFVIESMRYATDPKHGRNANQYARSYAHMPLADVLAEEYSLRWNIDIDPATQIATASGVTNVLYCALQGLIDPGDEVLLLEPAFDIYSSQVRMAGGKCVCCPMRPDFSAGGGASSVFVLDLDELRSKITDRTKALILNTPHNPTGKMFNRRELRGIADIVLEHPGLVVLSDEVYEHIVFDREREPHLSIATEIDGMWDRTLTMSSSGKTFSCTGWKVGWAVGPPSLVKAVTAVQQWVNFSSATPTQDAIARAIPMAREPYMGHGDYYGFVAENYNKKKHLLLSALEAAGMDGVVPPGAFFVIADTSRVGFPYEEIARTQKTSAMPVSPMPRDWALSRWLTEEVGVTAIPPSAFYSTPNVHLAKDTLRFAFCKGDDTIRKAHSRLESYFR